MKGSDITKKKFNDKFSYSIKVADFYYKDTAQLMLNRVKNETFIKNYILRNGQEFQTHINI